MRIPSVTAVQMREVDRLMIEVYGIELIQMMENAGRHLAVLSRQHFLGGDPKGKRVLVLVGSGGNGGGGMVAARWLHNWGGIIQVCTTKPFSEFQGVPAHQLNILKNLGIPIEHDRNPAEMYVANLIIDAIIGYSLFSSPRGHAARLIRQANQLDVPILSLDVPSGIDASSGEAFDPHIQARATLTLALPKTGLLQGAAKSSVGALFLADIGVPPQLYADIGLKLAPLFSENEIVRL